MYKAIIKMKNTNNYYVDNNLYKSYNDYHKKHKKTSLFELISLFECKDNNKKEKINLL